MTEQYDGYDPIYAGEGDEFIIYGITQKGCSKCEIAKKFLINYPVEWLDKDESYAQFIIETYHIDHTPVFMIMGATDDAYANDNHITFSVIEVRKYFEENTSKQERT